MSKKSPDLLILFILLLARVRIDTLADQAALPNRISDVRRLVEVWWPAWSLDRLAHPQIDHMSLMFIVTSFALLGIYLLVDLFADGRLTKPVYWTKLMIILKIIINLNDHKNFHYF